MEPVRPLERPTSLDELRVVAARFSAPRHCVSDVPKFPFDRFLVLRALKVSVTQEAIRLGQTVGQPREGLSILSVAVEGVRTGAAVPTIATNHHQSLRPKPTARLVRRYFDHHGGMELLVQTQRHNVSSASANCWTVNASIDDRGFPRRMRSFNSACLRQ